MKKQHRQFDDDRLAQVFRDNRPDIQPSAEVKERVRRMVFDASGHSMPVQSTRGRAGRRFRIGPAVAAGLAAMAVIAFLLIPPEQAKADFAMVIKKLAEITSVSYSKTWSSPGQELFSAHIYAKKPGLVRMEMEGGKFSVTNCPAGRSMVVNPNNKTTGFRDFTPSIGSDDILDRLTHVKAADAQYAGHEVVSGVETEKYVITSGQGTIEVWTRPQTNLPEQIKVTSPNETYTIKNITWNPVLSSELFALRAPDGFKIDDPVGEASEKSLVELLNESAAIAQKYPPTMDVAGVLSILNRGANKPGIDGTGTAPSMSEEMKLYWKNSKRAIAFAAGLQTSGEFHYQGAIVRPGTANVPVCWWKESKNSSTWRVLLATGEVADLSDSELKAITSPQ